jgi:hypothetical protein
MVGVGGGEVALRITGVQKTKRRRQKSCLWTGLIHRGEDNTKSGHLLVGPGRYSGSISSTLEILITPHTDLPS